MSGDWRQERDRAAAEKRRLEEEENEKLREAAKTYFQENHGLQWVRKLGRGNNAETHHFRECKDGRYLRRLVIKIATTDQTQIDIRNEILTLGRYGGAEHINPLVAPTGSIPPGSLPRLVLAIDYCDNGSLEQLLRRLRRARVKLPNRMLWAMFLCLTRICVGLAYPPWGTGIFPAERERVPAGRAPVNFIHDDIHDENIMLDAWWPGSIEHDLTPTLKIIDFGKAKIWQGRTADQAMRKNIEDIAKIMSSVVVGRYTPWEEIFDQVDVPALNNKRVQVKLYPDLRGSEHVEKDLMDLIVRCQAVDIADRPSLAELLQAVQIGVTHQPNHYNGMAGINPGLESDTAIHGLIQTYLLNDNDEFWPADIPLPNSPPTSPGFRPI